MKQDDRPLGRGLEDVSHLFLSQKADVEKIDSLAGGPPERPLPREQTAASAVLLRPAEHVTREQVAAAVKEFSGAIEAGLTVIDAGIACEPYGEIDLLAVDRRCQLTIVDFEMASSDDLLIRGLGHFDWVASSIPNFRRMFRGQAINYSLAPRVVLLAPQFSARMRGVARQITRPHIYWVRYHLVETPGQPGILFEHLPAE